MTMIKRHGLTELYSPAGEAVAHIIFVHGLFGHSFKTWTARSRSSRISNSSLPPLRNDQEHGENLGAHGSGKATIVDEVEPWPKILLPSVTPHARIFTWGYDADVGGFLSSASQNTIHQHAGNLLSDLANLRETGQNKSIPIIFVVHSLGGIIVKDALNQSSSTEGTRLKFIAPATFGVIFLGTPHRGSRSASLGKIAYRVTLVATMRPNLKLLKGLERNSEILERVGDSFSQTMLRHNIRLYSFREEQITRKLHILKIMVVDPDSAKIGDGREEVGSIPADHSNMTKFESSRDVGFKRVSSQLRRWIDEIKAGMITEDEDDCLKSLDALETRTRIGEVHKSHEKTFHWLFDSTLISFSDWLRNERAFDEPIFWVHGKPGSGKSTLMKFAMNDPRTLELLSSRSTNIWTLAAFFFHDRGSSIQKSLAGMMQEILFSALNPCPALITFVIPIYLSLVQSQRTKRPKWDLESLEKTLLLIIQQHQVPVRLCLFLDALDEHDGDKENLARFAKELTRNANGENTHVKICLASRSWPVFKQHFGSCPGFAIHEHTTSDILAYTESRLSFDRQEPNPLLRQDQLMVITSQVTDRALGVFIWVRLVVDQLIKDIRDGTPFLVLEDLITKMPQELKDLYAHTLRRIDSEYCAETYIMLQTALCSLSPLQLPFFMKSASHNLGQPIIEDATFDSQLRRLESRSGGLLEAVYPDTELVSDEPKPLEELDDRNELALEDAQLVSRTASVVECRVQFIHQTVKEYVRDYQHDLGLKETTPTMQLESGYFYLLNSTGCPRPHFPENSHHWSHSQRYLLIDYAKLLEESLDTSNERQMRIAMNKLHEILLNISRFELLDWNPKARSFFEHWITDDEEASEHSVFVIAIAANLKLFASHQGKQYVQNPLYGRDRGRDSFLHIAAAGPDLTTHHLDHLSLIKALIAIGCPVDSVSGFPRSSRGTMTTPLEFLLTQENFNNRSDKARLEIARTLLEEGADPNRLIHTLDFGISTPIETLLESCVRSESAGMIRLLLQFGADPQARRVSDWTLIIARIRQDKEIIQALEDHGVYREGPVRAGPVNVKGAIAIASANSIAVGVPLTDISFDSVMESYEGVDLGMGGIFRKGLRPPPTY